MRETKLKAAKVINFLENHAKKAIKKALLEKSFSSA